MGNASPIRRKMVSNNAKIEYLASWPGSVLEWSNEDLSEYAKCFSALKVAAGKEISFKDPRSFFIVASGSVEVQAILPTIRKKTGNIREFLCKKDTGDMVFMPSMRKLIAESNAKHIYERENVERKNHSNHKNNITDLVDTISIKSINESVLLQLDWKRFENNFSSNVTFNDTSKIDIEMLRAMMETNLSDYLEKLPVLAEIPHTKLETFVRMCHYKVEKKGTVIFREGDFGEEVYIILSGEVKVEATASERMAELLQNPKDLLSKADSSDNLSAGNKIALLFVASQIGRREMMSSMKNHDETSEKTELVELARLSSGDYFGEMATFIELPRAATVTATSNILMASLSKTNFRILYNSISPDLQQNVEGLVKKHMIQNIFQLKCPFLDQLTVEKTDAMAELTTIKRLDPDTAVFKQDDEAHSFYFVYSGTLRVQKKSKDGDVKEVGKLYSGDYFGELAVINNSKRLATITTLTRVVLLELTSENFHLCFQDKPEIVSEFILRMKGRHIDLKTLMNHKLSRQVFREFLELEHGNENILFYDHVEDYRRHFDEATDEEREKRGSYIISEYLGARSENAVNVPSKMYDAAAKVLETKSFTKDCFEEQQAEIYKLMDRDLFHRFKNTVIYTALMEKVRSYDDIDVQLLA
mmetsp:Transcript_26664/g.32338  ORF Transcript_26664/g.32338 Transcript_26664/m.32338 type:complete len:645 (+) Transcript_26664:250-2184(+)